jgi:hypothetical protein
MDKVLLAQAIHGLSKARCEYLITDRRSFLRFLGSESGRYRAGR